MRVQAGRSAHPHIEKAAGVESFVNEGERVMLGEDGVGICDDTTGGVPFKLLVRVERAFSVLLQGVDGGCANGVNVDGETACVPASSVTSASPTGWCAPVTMLKKP